MTTVWNLARPLLHAIPPERAHDLTIKALHHLPLPRVASDDPRLAVEAFGLRFANPIGLAAGFDKNGVMAHRAGALGFGFAEVGTVTPLPQPGNPKPRLFRLRDYEAVINRFGFNNAGIDAVRSNQATRQRTCVIGINVGANKEATDRVADYARGVRQLAEVADYFTVNISSPNTPNLRDLQKRDALDDLLARVLEARDSASRRRPVLLKIAPDLDLHELDDIVAVARRRAVDGLIVSNTTIGRSDALRTHPHGSETGGLSGKPLFELSTRVLAEAFIRTERQFPLVGVGGVSDAESALAKIEAGATLVQLYTALVYGGPTLVATMKRDLVAAIGQITLAERVGRNALALTRR